MTTLSVVVVVHNRFDDADEALRSLYRQTLSGLEIIVIDDASHGRYRPPSPMGDRVRLRLYRSDEELGLGLARSIGAMKASGRYIAFIDDDAVAEERWAEEIVACHEKGYDIVGGAIHPLFLAEPPAWWRLELFGYMASVGNYLLKETHRVEDLVWGTNFSVARRVFENIGYFLPGLGRIHGKLLSGEESEFFIRAKRHGYRIGFSENAIVYHKVYPYRFSSDYMLRRSWSQGASLRRILELEDNATMIALRGLSIPLKMFYIAAKSMGLLVKGYSMETSSLDFVCNMYRYMGFLSGVPR